MIKVSRRIARGRGIAAMLGVALLLGAAACRGQGEAAPAELEARVDSLLPALERLSGLEARAPVQVERQGRETLREYVQARLAEELPPEQMAGLQSAYQAFGLIPDTLNLRRLFLELYSEQVMGYYDPASETLFVMEGVSAEALEPVLAHEMVHALQDQYVDVDSLVSFDRGNDKQLAAQAAIEGHATLVMFAVLSERRTGQPVDITRLPDLGEQLRPTLEAQNEEFPVFRSAPRLIRETLLFPYVEGAAFVQALWREAGVGDPRATPPPVPFDTLLPMSTEQVLHPETRFLDGRDAPADIVFTEPAAPSPGAAERSSWRTVYENSLGQFEMSILLSEHLGGEADTLAAGWDGDRYRLIESLGGRGGIVWVSLWDDAAAADAFADAYRRVADRRAGRHGRVERIELEGRPAVRVVDAPESVALDEIPLPEASIVRGGES